MDKLLRSQIRFYANTLYDFQKMRIQCTNRIDALIKGESPEEVIGEFEISIANPLERLEKAAHDKLAKLIQPLPVYDWLVSVSGIADRLAIAIIAYFPDPDNTLTVSKLWAYSGMGVIPVCLTCKKIAHQGPKRQQFIASQGERRWVQYSKKEKVRESDKFDFIMEAWKETDKLLCNCEEKQIVDCAPDKKYYKGLLLDYNPLCKSLAWKCAWCFTMQGYFYRDIYDKYRARYDARPDITVKKRAALMAMRATAKLFLAHYWMRHRELSGLPQGKIYLQERYEREGIPWEPHMLILPPLDDKKKSKEKKNGSSVSSVIDEDLINLDDLLGEDAS